MNSCSSSKPDEQNSAKNQASNFLILSLPSPPFNFIHSNTPFFRQPLLMEPSNVVREVQKSIFANVDKCLRMLDNFRSQNEVLDKMMSFCSNLESCCQIPRRNCQNLAMLSNSNFAAILPGDSVGGLVVANGISSFLNIYNTLLVVRLVLTWFPSAPPAIVSPLSTLCDPYLNIFRGLIPPLGGLDLSPILAFLVLNAFTSSAAALPAELPSTEVSKDIPSHTIVSHLTATQKKWMRRLAGNKSKRSHGAIQRSRRNNRISSHEQRLLAIGLAILAILSPLYIDRNRSIIEPELDEEPVNLSSYLPLLLLVLIIAITISGYLEQGFSMFDPYWIHRAGGSSIGILTVLIILALVLKFK